jgi:nucleoside 2-deoxyribosyltransferase
VRQLPRLYLAAPLFSEAERAFNLELAQRLETYFSVFLPQRDGGLLVELLAGGSSIEEAKRRVFQTDMRAIHDTEVLVAVLDGRSVDEGVVVELTIAYQAGKYCIGLQTDPRRLLPYGNNPMIDGMLPIIPPSCEALLEWAKAYTQ